MGGTSVFLPCQYSKPAVYTRVLIRVYRDVRIIAVSLCGAIPCFQGTTNPSVLDTGDREPWGYGIPYRAKTARFANYSLQSLTSLYFMGHSPTLMHPLWGSDFWRVLCHFQGACHSGVFPLDTYILTHPPPYIAFFRGSGTPVSNQNAKKA